jgi:hypothetical protein
MGNGKSKEEKKNLQNKIDRRNEIIERRDEKIEKQKVNIINLLVCIKKLNKTISQNELDRITDYAKK